MRLRRKKNRDQRFSARQQWLLQPEQAGEWCAHTPLYIEIGAGKGGFITTFAAAQPTARFIAVEREMDCIIMAMEQAERMGLSNLRFLHMDAANLTEVLPLGSADEIYINFCDPWPKKKQAKRRLTHRNMLRHYLPLLKKETGILRFKTDNTPLFDFTEEEWKALDFSTSFITRDLHQTNTPNIMTEYEKRFSEMGVAIKSLWVTPTEKTWAMLEEYAASHPIRQDKKASD